MDQQLAALGLTGERLDAVTIDDIDPALLAYHGPDRPFRCAPAAIACGLSHAAAWQTMVARDYEAAIILEDDVAFAPNFRAFTQPGVLERAGADIIKLETWRKSITLGSRVSRLEATELRELTSGHLGSAAYLISRAAAERSLADPLLHRVAIDEFLFTLRGAHLLRSRVLQASPSPAVQLHKHIPTSELARSDIFPQRAVPGAPRTEKPRTRPARPPMGRHRLRRALVLLQRDPLALLAIPARVPFGGDAALSH
jgi:GR25 family glycosyltransferase involved in LPS biosynthesis